MVVVSPVPDSPVTKPGLPLLTEFEAPIELGALRAPAVPSLTVFCSPQLDRPSVDALDWEPWLALPTGREHLEGPVQFSDDGRWLVLSKAGRRVLSDLLTGDSRELPSAESPGAAVALEPGETTLAFSADSTLLGYLGGSPESRELTLLGLLTGQQSTTPVGLNVVLRRDGGSRLLASAHDARARTSPPARARAAAARSASLVCPVSGTLRPFSGNSGRATPTLLLGSESAQAATPGFLVSLASRQLRRSRQSIELVSVGSNTAAATWRCDSPRLVASSARLPRALVGCGGGPERPRLYWVDEQSARPLEPRPPSGEGDAFEPWRERWYPLYLGAESWLVDLPTGEVLRLADRTQVLAFDEETLLLRQDQQLLIFRPKTQEQLPFGTVKRGAQLLQAGRFATVGNRLVSARPDEPPRELNSRPLALTRSGCWLGAQTTRDVRTQRLTWHCDQPSAQSL